MIFYSETAQFVLLTLIYFMLVHVFTLVFLEASNEAVQIKCTLLNLFLITASFFTFIRDFFKKVLIVYYLIQFRGLDGHRHFYRLN